MDKLFRKRFEYVMTFFDVTSIHKSKKGETKQGRNPEEFWGPSYIDQMVAECLKESLKLDEEHRLHTLENKVSLLLDNLGFEYKIEPATEARAI